MTLINPADSLERQNEKLLSIAASLMRRVEQQQDPAGLAYAQFERAALLEDQVRTRTLDLERALDLLHDSNLRLEQANAQTEAARDNLADAIEAVNEGFALFDAQDALVLTNSRFCKGLQDIMHRIRPGLSFRDYVDLVSTSAHLTLPEGETTAGWAAMRMTRHRRRQGNDLFNVQLRDDRWLQVSERRTRTGGTVVLQTDVTELVRLEREERSRLESQQARLISATLEHLNQGVCIFDAEARLMGWNARVAELLRVPLNRIYRGARFDAMIDELPRGLTLSEGMALDRLRAWALHPAGALRFEATQGADLILDAYAQRLPDGGFLISFTDVTAERNAARALQEMNERLEARVAERTTELASALSAAERANASKSRFVAAASHDLLQPLSAAKLFIDSLQGEALSPGGRDTLSKVGSALGSVEHIIEALLDISKLDSRHAIFDIRPISLSRIFSALHTQLEPLAAQKNLRLSVVPTTLEVESDPSYLRRILQNLLGNAVRYTDEGRVLMGVRRAGADVRIEVRDTGPGIAEEHQGEIFREFARVNAPASATEGLGLGLAIVERACAGLGHRLDLRSEPGRGTMFSVTLPRAGAAVTPLPDTAPRQRTRARGQMVFVVENDVPMRRALTMALESNGAGVIDVGNAEEALDLLAELGLTPDALLLDDDLGPGLGGTALYAEITRRHGPIPARILSANRSEDLRRRCADLGVPLLQKPLDTAELDRFLSELP